MKKIFPNLHHPRLDEVARELAIDRGIFTPLRVIAEEINRLNRLLREKVEDELKELIEEGMNHEDEILLREAIEREFNISIEIE